MRRIRRQHRFVFQLVNLISGVWGIYNGIYTRQQLDQLHRDLTKVEDYLPSAKHTKPPSFSATLPFLLYWTINETDRQSI